jgi:hypothetical protein
LEEIVVADAILGTINGYTNRLIRVATVLVDMHMDIAMREAAWEKRRLTSGFILLAIGGALMTFFGLLCQAIAIVSLQSLTRSWVQAMLIVTGVDFLIGSIFLLAAIRKLRGPYMVQTQARVARTASTLMQDQPAGARAESVGRRTNSIDNYRP